MSRQAVFKTTDLHSLIIVIFHVEGKTVAEDVLFTCLLSKVITTTVLRLLGAQKRGEMHFCYTFQFSF